MSRVTGRRYAAIYIFLSLARLRYYGHKHFLTPYVDDLVQRRHTLKRATGAAANSPLMLDLLKLLFNGL